MTYIKYGLMVLVNLVFFYYLYMWVEISINWLDLKEALVSVPDSAIAWVLILELVALGLYGLRLATLIEQRLLISFWIVVFGFGANCILPMRLGDVAKLYYARRYYCVSATKLLFVKMMEKFFDLSFLLAIGFIPIILGGIVIEQIYLLVISLSLVAGLIVAMIAINMIRRDHRWVTKMRHYKSLNHFINMFEEVTASRFLKKSLLITMVIWLLTIAMMYFYYKIALGQYQIGWYDAFALVFITSLSLGIPSSPGGLGVFEAGIVIYLTNVIGVSPEQALATALIFHLLLVIPQIILMLGSMLAIQLPIVKLNNVISNKTSIE